MPKSLVTSRALPALVVLAVTLVGCVPEPPADAAPSPPPAPRIDVCRVLSADDVDAPDDTSPAVDCDGRHTAVTFHVDVWPDRLVDLVGDVEADALARHASRVCQEEMERYVGDPDRTRLRLSLLAAAWFRPTAEEFAAGAQWFRCDLVARARTKDGSDGRTLPLPATTAGMLAAGDVPERLRRCARDRGRRPDGTTRTRPVPCDRPHDLWAVSVGRLPDFADVRDDDQVRSMASRACRKAVPKKRRWDYYWTIVDRADWDRGVREVLCWKPVERRTVRS